MAVQKVIEEISCKGAHDQKQEDNSESRITENTNKTDNMNNQNTATNTIEFDDLLSSAGEFGLYQVLLFFSTLPFYIYGVFVYFIQLFLTEVSPNHWCWIPELENLTDVDRRRLAIPQDAGGRFGYSRCEAYEANWTEVLMTGLTPNESWPTTKCQYGWEFNKTEIPYPTISSELGWVCEKDSYQATAQSIFCLGAICGGFVIGIVADRFGRLPATVVSNIIGCIFGIVSMFARNFIEFAICRFLTGLAYDNCMTMVYLLVLEYVGPNYRSVMANVSFALFYGTTVTLLPWLALACGHWKTILLVTSLPLSLSVLTPFIMPESPRWLLSRGRVDDAVNKILTIGRINKKEVPSKLIEQFKLSVSQQKQEERGSILLVLKNPLLRKMFICICLLYTSCALVFDGLVRSIGQLQYNFFLSFCLISLTEIPSVFIVAFLMDWLGRRWVVSITMTFTMIFCILTVFVPGGIVSVSCAIVARFAVNMAYAAAMQWSAELLPVSVRGSGLAIIHICAFIGYFIAPFIIYLETYVHWVPSVVIGCVAGLSGFIALALPETAKKEMPQTFADAEKLIRGSPFWDVPFMRKKIESTGQVNDSFDMSF